MKALRVSVCALGLLAWSAAVHAQTKAACLRGDCEYRFDDEALNAPGQSAYGQWFVIKPPARRVMLIRPRISFVPEMLKSAQAF